MTMKTIIAISLIYFIALVIPQEPLSKGPAIKAPRGAEKKSREQIVDYEKENFKFKRFSATRGTKKVYKIGGVLLAFEDSDYPKVYNSTLEDLRDKILGEVEEIRSAGTNDKVDIMTFNGTKYLIRKRDKGDEYFYMFTSEEKNRKGIQGVLLFKKADLDKADKILKTWLSSFKI